MQLQPQSQPSYNPPLSSSRRMPFIDELRGLCIIYVMFYHLLYDLDPLFGLVDLPFFWSRPMQLSRIFIVMLLMFLSGLSCSLSRNNFKRACRILGIALVISIVTYIFLGEHYILFGILHFFGCAILIYCGIGKYIKRLPKKSFTVIFFLLFLFTFNIYDGAVSLFGFTLIMPDFLYNKLWLVPVGFGSSGFSSVDYYPIFPWLFVFLIGTLYGDSMKNDTAPHFFYKKHSSTLTWIGQHTLSLYILHQPIFYGFLWLISEL